MLKHLFKPLDAAILVYFRFFAGIFLSMELMNSLSLGDFQEYSAPFHFTYYFFDWIKPWPALGMILHYFLTIAAGLTLAFGFYQRLSAIILFIGYTLLFLMEKSEYINHLYLYCLISFWLIFLPVEKNGKLSSPTWYYYLLLFHISVVYFFAGVAKLDPEWLSGDSAKTMFGGSNVAVYTYGGLIFDLLIVPFLFWKKTRTIAFIFACLFHLINVFNFGLATFPWFSIMMTTLFFGDQWPRHFKWFQQFIPNNNLSPPSLGQRHQLLATLLFIYVGIQLVLPLRHHLYPGQVSWTEDGHQFSWRMKLRSKSGDVVFYAMDRTTREMKIIFPQHFLTSKQYRDMIGKPDSMLQFAHYLRDKYPQHAIYASARVALNGKSRKEMIQPHVDLAREKRKLGSYSWIRSENKSIMVQAEKKMPGFLRALELSEK